MCSSLHKNIIEYLISHLTTMLFIFVKSKPCNHNCDVMGFDSIANPHASGDEWHLDLACANCEGQFQSKDWPLLYSFLCWALNDLLSIRVLAGYILIFTWSLDLTLAQ